MCCRPIENGREQNKNEFEKIEIQSISEIC